MLESHRQNSISMDCKFLPFASLMHTVHVNNQRFNTKVKVSAYSHSWDFTSKRGRTTLTGKFFMNPGSDNRTLSGTQKPPARPALTGETYEPKITLQDYVIPYKMEVIETDPNANKDPDEIEEDINDSGKVIEKNKFRLYKCNGYVRRETGYIFKGVKVKRSYAFRVITPDIEEKSTDTQDADGGKQILNMAIPHNEPFPSFTCRKK